jgi:hypothetical protein
MRFTTGEAWAAAVYFFFLHPNDHDGYATPIVAFFHDIGTTKGALQTQEPGIDRTWIACSLVTIILCNTSNTRPDVQVIETKPHVIHIFLALISQSELSRPIGEAFALAARSKSGLSLAVRDLSGDLRRVRSDPAGAWSWSREKLASGSLAYWEDD